MLLILGTTLRIDDCTVSGGVGVGEGIRCDVGTWFGAGVGTGALFVVSG